MMPELAATHESVGDEVQFVSVTSEPLGGTVTREDVAELWAGHDGSWPVAADRNLQLRRALAPSGVPYKFARPAKLGRLAESPAIERRGDDLADSERARSSDRRARRHAHAARGYRARVRGDWPALRWPVGLALSHSRVIDPRSHPLELGFDALSSRLGQRVDVLKPLDALSDEPL